jgi:hypothetical protein
MAHINDAVPGGLGQVALDFGVRVMGYGTGTPLSRPTPDASDRVGVRASGGRHAQSGTRDASGRSVASIGIYLRIGLERTWFGEALDRYDARVVLGDALGC